MKPPILIFCPLLACLGSPAIAIDFAHEIVPILRTHCAECHAASEAKGGFSVNTRDSFLESEAAIVGDSEASYFLELVASADPDFHMSDHTQQSMMRSMANAYRLLSSKERRAFDIKEVPVREIFA